MRKNIWRKSNLKAKKKNRNNVLYQLQHCYSKSKKKINFVDIQLYKHEKKTDGGPELRTTQTKIMHLYHLHQKYGFPYKN